MRAVPAFCITDFASLKSALIYPVWLIKLEILLTPSAKTESTFFIASIKESLSPSSTISNNLWLGTTINVSTLSLKAAIPSSAISLRLFPSKSNGLVTTATVNAPIFFATPAMIGAAPVPVPPPIPAVIKTILAPSKSS